MAFDFRQFSYYHPYLTYANPNNDRFIAPTGKPTKELNADTEALFRLGKQAFKRLVQGGEFLREEFSEGYAAYWNMIDMCRETFAVMLDAGMIRPISDTTEQPISIDIKKADDDQIISLCWQVYSKSWNKAEADDEDKSLLRDLFLFHALREIDNALIGLALDGEAVVAAIYAANSLSNAMAIDSGDSNLIQARKKFAYQAVIEKLKRDPKQREKKFVRECWDTWQQNPESYKSKAAFARDMLTKCEHLESQKKIEDWCRAWEAANGTQPA